MFTLRNALFVIGILVVLATAAAVGDQALQSTHKQNNSSIHDGGTHEQSANVPQPTYAIHADGHAATHGGHSDLDAIALDDIHRYAAHHLRGAVERPNTFHSTHNWEGDWELHSIDYDLGGYVVRVYHAIHKSDPTLRYASALHDSDGHYLSWQRIE